MSQSSFAGGASTSFFGGSQTQSHSRSADGASADGDGVTSSTDAQWWLTPPSDYVKLGAIDPAIFGLDISDVGGDVDAGSRHTSPFFPRTLHADASSGNATATQSVKGLPRVRHPDENPIDWSTERRAPPDPVQVLDLKVGEAPKVANDIGDQPVPMPRHHDSPENRPIPFRPEPDLDRHRYWAAFAAAAAHAQVQHDEMGIRLVRMKSAQHDTQLGALGFDKPKGWEGDIATLTENQHVPLKNGVTIGSLFDEKNSLRLDTEDEAAIQSGASAVEHGVGGKNGIQMRGLDTQDADKGLHVANEAVKQQFHLLTGAKARLQSAILAIESFELQGKADDVRAEIESLRAEVGSAREVVELLGNIASGVAYVATGEIGDAIDKAGVVAATLIGHVNDRKIDRAIQRLTRIEKDVKTVEAKRLASELSGTRADVEAAKSGVADAGGKLQVALTHRRVAYNNLALTASEHVSGSESSRRKITGIMAAIPLVEIVVSKARGLSQTSTPPAYSELAGRGLGMAKANGLPAAGRFLRACAELAHVKLYATTIEGEWTQRLDALVQVKQQILGLHPGED